MTLGVTITLFWAFLNLSDYSVNQYGRDNVT